MPRSHAVHFRGRARVRHRHRAHRSRVSELPIWQEMGGATLRKSFETESERRIESIDIPLLYAETFPAKQKRK